jgi:molybdopterin-guanine dinucleotide biosynthesis protein A
MTAWGILAGGQGTRFGGPKVDAIFNGRTFLEHSLDRISLVAGSEDVILVSLPRDCPSSTLSRIPETFRALPIVRIFDTVPNLGPVHGVANMAAVSDLMGHELIVTAVDQLGLGQPDLLSILDACRRHPESVSVAQRGGRRHWVFVGIPKKLLSKIVGDAHSVSSLQSLYLVNEVVEVEVSADAVLDVNSISLLPTSTSHLRGESSAG